MVEFTEDDTGTWFLVKAALPLDRRRVRLVQVLQNGKGVFRSKYGGSQILSSERLDMRLEFAVFSSIGAQYPGGK